MRQPLLISRVFCGAMACAVLVLMYFTAIGTHPLKPILLAIQACIVAFQFKLIFGRR